MDVLDKDSTFALEDADLSQAGMLRIKEHTQG